MLNNFMFTLMSFFTDVKEREEGQGLVEYALILVLVSIVAITALEAIGTNVTGVFTDVAAELT